jgi:hypothetical protein
MLVPFNARIRKTQRLHKGTLAIAHCSQPSLWHHRAFYSQDQNEVPDLSDSDPDKDSGDCCTCDGPCNRSFSSYYGIALCRYCHDVAFCEPCLKLLKEDDLQTNVCNPKHDWLVIPPPEKTVGAGELLVAGEAVAVEDWKKSLKQQWQV